MPTRIAMFVNESGFPKINHDKNFKHSNFNISWQPATLLYALTWSSAFCVTKACCRHDTKIGEWRLENQVQPLTKGICCQYYHQPLSMVHCQLWQACWTYCLLLSPCEKRKYWQSSPCLVFWTTFNEELGILDMLSEWNRRGGTHPTSRLGSLCIRQIQRFQFTGSHGHTIIAKILKSAILE